MIKVVLSDMDDTLINSIASLWQKHKLAASRFGVELSDEKLARHWGEPFSQLIFNLYELVDTSQIPEATAHYESLSRQFPKTVKPGAIKLLTELSHKGVLTGIITAASRQQLMHNLQTLGFDYSAICYLQSADDSLFHKPDPRVFEPAFAYLREDHEITDPLEVLYIGDSLRDYYAARDAGMQFIGIPNGIIETAEDFRREGAICVDSLAELYEMLLGSRELKVR